MSVPTLSVSMITRNRPSMARQRLLEMSSWIRPIDGNQLVVSDDSDTNELGGLLKSHGIEYHWNGQRLGQFSNANRALARARCDWVVIAHDDDDLYPTMLGLIHEHGSNPDLAVITGRSAIEGDATVAKIHEKKVATFGFREDKFHPGREVIELIHEYGNPFIFANVAFRREAGIAAGLFDWSINVAGDLEFWMRVLEHGDVLFDEDVTVGSYNLRDDNLSLSTRARRDLTIEKPLIMLESLIRNPSLSEGKRDRRLTARSRKALLLASSYRHRLDLAERLAGSLQKAVTVSGVRPTRNWRTIGRLLYPGAQVRNRLSRRMATRGLQGRRT